MIVSRTQAEEASKELLIHVFFLQGLTVEVVQQAYRSRARETHPDTGGTLEQFVAVDRAKHVLIAWLNRQPEAVAKALQPELCNACDGTGTIHVGRGFVKPLRMQCGKCKGTGDLSYDHDKTTTD